MHTDHGQVDAAGAAFEVVPKPVDEEVVAHVVPAAGVAVETRDRERESGRLLRAVLVRALGVVDDGEINLAVRRQDSRRDQVAAHAVRGTIAGCTPSWEPRACDGAAAA